MCGAHIFFFMESKVAVDFSYLLMPDKQGVKGHSKINYRTSVTPTCPSGHWLCQGHWPQTADRGISADFAFCSSSLNMQQGRDIINKAQKNSSHKSFKRTDFV